MVMFITWKMLDLFDTLIVIKYANNLCEKPSYYLWCLNYVLELLFLEVKPLINVYLCVAGEKYKLNNHLMWRNLC